MSNNIDIGRCVPVCLSVILRHTTTARKAALPVAFVQAANHYAVCGSMYKIIIRQVNAHMRYSLTIDAEENKITFFQIIYVFFEPAVIKLFYGCAHQINAKYLFIKFLCKC